MDSLITAAARALASGDALGALNYIALRDDPPALALRGIAMAQLGDFARAKLLLRWAARAFGPKEAIARARCVIAEAEIALVSRDLAWPLKPLESARSVLERYGDRANAAHARYLKTRYLLLIGHLDEAEHLLARISIPLRCHPHQGRPTSWSSPASQCGACGLGRRAPRWRRPNAPQAKPASLRSRLRSKARLVSSTRQQRG